MKKSKVIFLALLAFAFGASARTVTSEEAKNAARAWVHRGRTLGARFPSDNVQNMKAHTTTNGAMFYTVKMANGGTVFMSGDTTVEPVICFTSDKWDYSTIDKNSPLWALLNKDVSGSRPSVKPALTLATMVSATQQAVQGENERKWAKLIDEGEELSVRLKFFLAATALEIEPGDLRVDKIMEATWDQGDAGGGYHRSDNSTCYNYYTPQNASGNIIAGDKENAVCGCVATAMSQIMFTHKFPESAVAGVHDHCWYDTTQINLAVSGEAYAWGTMEASPQATASKDVRKAIGLLTADAGRAVGMAYTRDDSGSFTFKARKAMTDVFRYAEAAFVDNDDVAVTDSETLGKVMFANFDAGYPVLLGISGAGGHEIVGDGYGFQDNVPYVHLNMGWSGQHNIWYNLPEIGSFSSVDDVVYNIFPNKTGCGIIAGRVTDDDGEAFPGVEVSICRDGEVIRTTTSASGVWSAIVSNGSYDVSFRDPVRGWQDALESPVKVSAPVETTKHFRWETPLYKKTGKIEDAGEGDYPAVQNAESIGNSWGNDMVLAEPTVRIVVDATTNLYTSLDKALRAATNGNDTVEILLPTILKKPVTVGVDCTVVATNADAAVSQVIRNQGASLTIAAGATVTLSNVVFSASTEPLVAVEGGGCLKLGPKVDMGVDLDHVSISTEDANGLDLAGELTQKLLFHCDAATASGATFCTYSCDEATAERCAGMIVCADDDDRKTRGKVGSPGTLAWTTADVPIDEAFGYFVDTNGFTNTFAQAGKAFLNFKEALDRGVASELIVRKPGTFPVCFDKIALPVLIRGEGEPRPVLTATSTSGFRILGGGSLMVSNVVFRGYEAPLSGGTFIEVNGGELTLDDGAVLDGIVGRACRASGVVDLLAGAVTMLDGSAIVNCAAEGTSAQGGAIYMECSDGSYDCMLNIFGGTVSNCQSVSYGGGIYVAADECYQGEVNLSGRVTIVDNRAGATTDGPDDLYVFSDDEIPYFRLVGELGKNSHVGIRYSSSSSSGNAEGDAFMTNAVGVVSRDTLKAFVNDTTNTLEAAVGDNGMLVWVKRDMSGTCSEADATTHVYYPDGGVTNHYADLATAFAHMTNGTVATVKMYKEGQSGELFDADVMLPAGCKVVLMSGGNVGYEFLRAGDVGLLVTNGASLTLTNILFKHEDHNRATKPYLEVVGGSLTLMSGACVAAGTGNTCRDANGITVYEGGVFTILPGAKVCDCYSSWNEGKFTPDTATQYYAVGGGVLIDGGSTANLRGGEITGCHAPRGGGLYACNGSKVYVSGDMKLVGNREISYEPGVPGNPSNLLVTDLSELYLDNVLSGDVHVANSVRWRGDTNIVAMVAADWKWGIGPLTNSASHFISDETGDFGVVVTNAAETLVVWSRAVRNGVFVSQDTVRDDKTFYVVAEVGAYTPLSMSPLPELDPNAKTADAVKSALTISDLADKSAEEAINDSADPVKAYEEFREWAMGVKGGADAVVESDKAGVSYDFGTTELLTEDPAVEIVELVETDDGLEISVIVKDGEDPVEVASKKVAEMLEGSTDVAAWDDNRTELEVTDLTQSTADEVSFKVKPADDVPAAFIRVKR